MVDILTPHSRDFFFQSLNDGLSFCRKNAHSVDKWQIFESASFVEAYVKLDICICLHFRKHLRGNPEYFSLFLHRIPLRRTSHKVLPRSDCRVRNVSATIDSNSHGQANSVPSIGYTGYLARNTIIRSAVFSNAVWFQPDYGGFDRFRDSLATPPGQAVFYDDFSRFGPREVGVVFASDIGTSSDARGIDGLIENSFGEFHNLSSFSKNMVRDIVSEHELINLMARCRIILRDKSCIGVVLKEGLSVGTELVNCFVCPSEAAARYCKR
ncbi:hypothetical protein SAMN04488077_102270 [Roseovarius tolerans]|uniref:Uncharacterized protein n=1 Tax=Roseovarius tolerans TaxID=74031 RepID=A0A1H7W3W8_9RHOB|nr:hypothetical protein SAMN04488077_102270 [Roseovarius tolerans]